MAFILLRISESFLTQIQNSLIQIRTEKQTQMWPQCVISKVIFQSKDPVALREQSKGLHCKWERIRPTEKYCYSNKIIYENMYNKARATEMWREEARTPFNNITLPFVITNTLKGASTLSFYHLVFKLFINTNWQLTVTGKILRLSQTKGSSRVINRRNPSLNGISPLMDTWGSTMFVRTLKPCEGTWATVQGAQPFTTAVRRFPTLEGSCF